MHEAVKKLSFKTVVDIFLKNSIKKDQCWNNCEKLLANL